MGERLAFACRACKQVHDIVDISNKKGFELVAFHDVIEWSDFTDEVPAIDIKIWQRSNVTPIKGEKRKVQAHSHFNFEVGEEFWTLFYPALSSFNGWDTHPDEIDCSALIKCMFHSVISKSDERAWIRVVVEEVIPFTEICDIIPMRKGLLDVKTFTYFRHLNKFTYQNWIYYSAGSEGDIGRWALVKKHNEVNIVVAYGEWDIYSDIVYFGNVVLSQEENNDLIKMFSYENK